MKGLGARIAAARKNAALSQATLGQRLGVGQTAVSYWEADKREPCLADLVALARELGVTLAELAGEDTSPGDAYWVGWRAGWLGCANAVQAAATLRPELMPSRSERATVTDRQLGWRVDGRDWPAGGAGLSSAEAAEWLDGITPRLAEQAGESLRREAGEAS